MTSAGKASSREMSPKGARRVREILEAGSRVLLSRGLWAVNKRRVAEELGISDGNVGYYFPTRDSLWLAIIQFEMDEYYRRHHPPSEVAPGDVQARFDEYVMRWMNEYEDSFVRIFFSQIITVAEVNDTIAASRDRIYEAFVEQFCAMARPLVPGVGEEELETRVLACIALLEGLHAVSAFRPATMRRDRGFKRLMQSHVNALIRGGDWRTASSINSRMTS